MEPESAAKDFNKQISNLKEILHNGKSHANQFSFNNQQLSNVQEGSSSKNTESCEVEEVGKLESANEEEVVDDLGQMKAHFN